MGVELILILGSAAFIGFIHTLLGPDHYVPFVALARSRNWSIKKHALSQHFAVWDTFSDRLCWVFWEYL